MYRHVLRRNRVKLVNNITDHEAICQELIQQDIISNSNADDILCRNTNASKSATLVDIVTTRGECGFDVFCRALRNTNHTELADLIDPQRQHAPLDNTQLVRTLPDMAETFFAKMTHDYNHSVCIREPSDRGYFMHKVAIYDLSSKHPCSDVAAQDLGFAYGLHMGNPLDTVRLFWKGCPRDIENVYKHYQQELQDVNLFLTAVDKGEGGFEVRYDLSALNSDKWVERVLWPDIEELSQGCKQLTCAKKGFTVSIVCEIFRLKEITDRLKKILLSALHAVMYADKRAISLVKRTDDAHVYLKLSKHGMDINPDSIVFDPAHRDIVREALSRNENPSSSYKRAQSHQRPW